MLYVKMIDKFFSGWGMAEGKKSVYVIACYTSVQAQAIAKAARKRTEMISIKIQTTMPKASDTSVITVTDVGDLSGAWLEFMPAAEFQE
jgi:hypothetical protein